MKIAIVHYWFVAQRGGEKVVEELCRLFPQADLFTHVLDPARLSPELATRSITTSFVNALPWAKRCYQYYLPLMPLALEQFDLRGYDLVISSESGPAKGVITDARTIHLCYCHTPMRYLWDMTHDYTAGSGPVKRALMAPALHYLRMWDRLSADRVDRFIANSANVARRIAKHYRRDSVVIHPPVDTEAFRIADQSDDFYLMVGQLVRYKRADLAVKAFTRMGRRLVILGEGEEMGALRKIAGPFVEFLGWQPFAAVRERYARCRALVFPGEEDFGLVPVEAMASGRPVIAYGRGGAVETVVDGRTGLFFSEQTVESLTDAVRRFEAMEHSFVPEDIRRHATRFGVERFGRAMRDLIEDVCASSRTELERVTVNARTQRGMS